MFVFSWVGEHNNILILHVPSQLDSSRMLASAPLEALKRY